MTTAEAILPDQHQLQVCESLAGIDIAVDRERGIVRGVKVLGFEAKNGRYYKPATQKSAVSLYEGVKVNVDHPESDRPHRPRRFGERFGVLKNARYQEGQGILADLHYNPKHQFAEQFAWEAENNPGNVGFSHNAMVKHGKRSAGRIEIEEIVDVRSVDLVADPATTKGIFESEGHSTNEVEEMDLSKLTLSDLRKERPDLISSLESEQEGAAELEKLRGELKDAKEAVQRLESEKQAAEMKLAIESELSKAGFDPTNKHEDKRRHVSDVFRKQLEACESVEDRKAVIDDRIQVVGEWKSEPAKPGTTPRTTPATEGEQLSHEEWLKRLRA